MPLPLFFKYGDDEYRIVYEKRRYGWQGTVTIRGLDYVALGTHRKACAARLLAQLADDPPDRPEPVVLKPRRLEAFLKVRA